VSVDPPPDSDFLSLAGIAIDETQRRLPETDRSAMAMVLLLTRVASGLVYDLESTVHRPAGWSWSAWRLLFTIWVAGPQESRRAAELSGMSRAAVSSLTNTLSAAGLLDRTPGSADGRSVILALSEKGTAAIEETFLRHNAREAEWARLLDPGDLADLNRLLAKLARAAHTAEWVNRR
jgi:DNA-binding MarR family transcriptional regulator